MCLLVPLWRVWQETQEGQGQENSSRGRRGMLSEHRAALLEVCAAE